MLQCMSKSELQPIGDTIAQLRKKRRWTQRELADRMHIHQSMVTRWEKGQVEPRNETLERLAATFDVSVDDLLTPQFRTASEANGMNDPELFRLFTQASILEAKDREILKGVLEAMLVRRRVKELSSFDLAG